MKLKTRLIISFVIITILPAVLAGFVVWGVANYHINAIEQTYGISGEEYREFKQSLGTLNEMPEVHEFLVTMMGGVILILALTAMTMILWIYRSLLRPIEKMEIAVKSITEGELDFELRPEKNDEIGQLCKDIETMRRRLKDNAEEKLKNDKDNKELISNISHDLKTPIALIKSYSQSVKDDIYPYGDKNSSMDIIIENAERLDGKVKSLLYLNRLDFISGENSDSEVDMHELIEHIVIQLQGMHPEIEIETDLAFVSFKGDEECWRICVENIVDNAYRYVDKKIKIILKNDYLEIYNDGEPIDNDNIEALFQPYEKGTKGQFGLGLSIVHKTCTMYGYNVTAVNQETGVSFIIEKKYN